MEKQDKKNEQDWGKKIENKLEKLPKPVSALGDGVCITVCLFIIYWLLERFEVVDFRLDWYWWVVVGIGVFGVSLIIRLFLRRR
jgi:hypothetical protein